jgi:hypothetical protein
VFICPKCNLLVENPEFVRPPWWWRMDAFYRKPMPVCPRGHRLRTEVFGNLKELSIVLAFSRAFFWSNFALALGMLEDARMIGIRIHLGLMGMAGIEFVLELMALSKAWSWAAMTGPAHLLTPRAFGTFLGYVLPALAGLHALYFHWADPLQNSFMMAVLHLFQ